jgi:hypothetical protein
VELSALEFQIPSGHIGLVGDGKYWEATKGWHPNGSKPVSTVSTIIFGDGEQRFARSDRRDTIKILLWTGESASDPEKTARKYAETDQRIDGNAQ